MDRIDQIHLTRDLILHIILFRGLQGDSNHVSVTCADLINWQRFGIGEVTYNGI